MQLDLLAWSAPPPTPSKAAAPWCVEGAALLVNAFQQDPRPSLEEIGAKLGRSAPPSTAAPTGSGS